MRRPEIFNLAFIFSYFKIQPPFKKNNMREREERDRDRFQIPCIPRKARKGSKKRLNINKEFPVTKYSRLGGIYHNQSIDIDP